MLSPPEFKITPSIALKLQMDPKSRLSLEEQIFQVFLSHSLSFSRFSFIIVFYLLCHLPLLYDEG